MAVQAAISPQAGAPLEPLAEGLAVRGRSPWQLFWTRFVKDRFAVAGLALVVELVILAIAAPLFKTITGHDPNTLFNSGPNSMLVIHNGVYLPAGPNSRFWFGGDQNGRDVFVRTIYGARTSLIVAFVATGAATVIGIILGVTAGYFGKWADTIISRLIDIVLSLPLLLFAIGLSSVCSQTAQGCLGGLLQPGLSLVIGIIALFTWPYIARIVRGQVLSLREREFIQAAEAMGAGDGRIMFREILPNLVAPITVYTTLLIPSNILFEAALSYLGVGVPPSTPSWGAMLSDATSGSLFTYAYWMMIYPGLFLLMTTVAFNLVGDGLRDALDPRGGR